MRGNIEKNLRRACVELKRFWPVGGLSWPDLHYAITGCASIHSISLQQTCRDSAEEVF